LLGINMNTLGKVFTHIVVVPGIYTYFLASEEPISLDFPSMISKRQIRTSYVNSDYLDAMHIQFDSEQLSERIRQQEVQTNRDLWPRLFFATLSGIQSKTGRHSMEVAGIISVLVFLVLLFRYGPVKRAMYVTGFSGAGIQILLIMALQSFYGYAYMLAPLMITLFMAGIVTGIITKGVWGRYSMNKLLSLVMIMSLIALICLLTTKTIPLSLSRFPGQLTLGVLNFIPGIVVGWVYALGVIAKEEKVKAIRGELYSADLTGAALGTILPTIFFLPLIGMANTFILLFGINLATGLSLMIRALKLRAYG